MKKIIAFLFILCSLNILAQHKYAKEFSFLNDNDLYTSTYNDKYYTNGMFLSYRYLSKKKTPKIIKKIYQFQLGHKMYTPFKATVELHGDHDRPFAAYFYGGFGIHKYYANNSILKTNIEIGIIGPDAFGWQLQDFIHDIYGFKKAVGWKYQIANAFALNFNTSYVKPLFKENHSYFDTNWINNLNIGTVFTDVSSGLYSRIGLFSLENLLNSIAFNANLNNKNNKTYNTKEAFFYIKPMLHYVVYDATIQGSFLNTHSPITYEINPFKFTTEIGIRFTLNRFNFGYAFNYHTKKLKSYKVPHWNSYGNIQLNYQFN